MRVVPWLRPTPVTAPPEPAPDPLTDPLTVAARAEPLIWDEMTAARMARTCVPVPVGDFGREP